jgi:hypothetical protein
MGLVITAQPQDEPVSITEAKLHLRISDSTDDTLIDALITATRQHAEMVTRRALITQSWKLVLDQFPNPTMNVASANWYGPQWGTSPGPLTMLPLQGSTGYEIYLPNPPLQSVDSIKYMDTNNVQQTLTAGTDYFVDIYSEPARILPANSKTWPSTINQINAIEVAFTCGYGVANAVPQAIKNWMLMRMGAMYENREEIIVAQRIVVAELPFVDGLLEPWRVVKY